MRIKKEKENIRYSDTKEFFAKRAKKYREDNPYSVTMHQNNNPELKSYCFFKKGRKV